MQGHHALLAIESNIMVSLTGTSHLLTGSCEIRLSVEAAIDLLASGTSSSGAMQVAREVLAHLSQCADIWHPETIPADETITGTQWADDQLRGAGSFCALPSSAFV